MQPSSESFNEWSMVCILMPPVFETGAVDEGLPKFPLASFFGNLADNFGKSELFEASWMSINRRSLPWRFLPYPIIAAIAGDESSILANPRRSLSLSIRPRQRPQSCRRLLQ